jgi:lipid II:glycine glycyltransferase (peptidoglycan interpeptide bridge formation enzyme)
MIKQVSWQEHLIRYYELHKWTCKQSNIAPHSFQYFELISRLSPENHKLFAAFNQDNVPVAYHNDLCFKENVFYHTAASSEEGNSKHAHYLLTWSSILSAHSEFYKNYEIGEICFGNVSKKHKQISFFKTRFGGELHRFFRADKEYEYLSRINILKKILKSTLDLACTFVANK